MRRILLLVFALVAASVLALPAHAGVGAHVAIEDFFFSPGVKTLPLANDLPVLWDNGGSFGHTAISNGGADFIDTGTIASGETGVAYLYGSGTFPYHCSIHENMKGKIRVRMRASPRAFVEGGSSTITYGSLFTKGIRWDVQRRRNGNAWTTIRSGTLNSSLTFSPSRPGRYDFRARTHDLSGHVSGWSPSRTVKVSAA